MIVVDTNVIVYIYLPNDNSEQADKVFQKDSDWAAPILWRSEFRSVLTVYMRKRLLTRDDAIQLMDQAIQLMRDREFDIDSFHVLDLSASSACSAYDCEYIALAQELNVPLITYDKQLLTEFPQTAISPDQFLKTEA